LYARAHYLHRSPEERYYFDKQVNLNVMLADYAKDAPENRINELISERIKDIFEPKEKSAYVEVIDGTEGLDKVTQQMRSRRVLVAVQPDGKTPPNEVQNFFASVIEKNNILILTGTQSPGANRLEESARARYATQAALRDLPETNPQRKELEKRHGSADGALTGSVWATYGLIYFPVQRPGQGPTLEKMSIRNEEGKGETAIIKALEGQRKLVRDLKDDNNFAGVLSKVVGELWGSSDDVVYADVERRAREEPKAYWLPPDGMKTLRDIAVQRGLWEDLGGGRVSKRVRPKIPSVQVGVDKVPTPTDHRAVLSITAVNASSYVVYYAENREATTSDPVVANDSVTTSEPYVSFLIVDKSKTNSPEAPNRSHRSWSSSLPIGHNLKSGPGSERSVTLHAHPKARMSYTTDATNPRDRGTPYAGPFQIGPEQISLKVHAVINDGTPFRIENIATFTVPPSTDGPNVDPWKYVSPGTTTQLVRDAGSRFGINDRANVYKALGVLKAGGVTLKNVDLRLERTKPASGKYHTRVWGEAPVTFDYLNTLLEHAMTLLGTDEGNDVTISLLFEIAQAENHTYLRELDALLEEPVREGEVRQ
jgi:hypothetical protein